MNLRFRLPVYLLILLVAISGCRKIVDYPDVPAISFTEAVSKDSTDVLGNPVKRVTVTFHLTDGDGDMGLSSTDITGPFHPDSAYHYNLFLYTYKSENGNFTAVPEPGFTKKFRIPDLTPTGQNKTLIADISVTVEYPYTEANPLPFSEFRYEFEVVDRSLNFSNRDTTSVIRF